MKSFSLRQRRDVVERWLDEKGRSSSISASRYLLHQRVTEAIRTSASGLVLEAGAGTSPFREELVKVATSLTRLDLSDDYGVADVVGDVQEMGEIETATYDTVLCTQVLEHIPDPKKALAEMRRVLRPNGVVILSAPHLSMIHEAPHDYFRYTQFGLRVLFESAGFGSIQIVPTAGVVAFLAHPVSVGFMSLAGPIPVVRDVAWLLNYLLLVKLGVWLDRLIGIRSLFPVDHLVVATAGAV